ncbi:hypothetical protein CWC47_29020 [Bacillus paranthracis]|uniref:Uncharacterized protein n=1 Tax=Bacillus cereus (strain AH187) TaxID=405534 RepID=B7I0Q1_BACC7|nr:hypothetical protein BCAH187_D0020 [Bacillus cereus AH187]MBR9742256.1 hypothetical protein [Bacillus paranthracis]SMD69310.1 hypothetical protein BACERE00176_00035 [Bacillus paranthracis]
MITEKITKTRFTINVNIGNIIHFVLILFGLGIHVAGISKVIGVYEFNFLLCVICFIFVSLHFACMYFILYIFTRDKK